MLSHNWNDQATAMRWDREGSQRNPIRSEQLDILLSIIESEYQPENWILDLGYGSGQVEELLFDGIPQAAVVGVDSSEAMMQLAAQRLSGYSNRFLSLKHDLGAIDSLPLPDHKYQFVIAIQSLHHLSKSQMFAVYEYAYSMLESGGMFLLLERLKVETEATWKVLQTVWQRQDKLYNSTVTTHEGESFAEHQRIVQERGDYPVALDEQTSRLPCSLHSSARTPWPDCRNETVNDACSSSMIRRKPR
jgi:tRNA (cmo5U34)-methyltransferase